MPSYTVTLFYKNMSDKIIVPFYCYTSEWVDKACKKAIIDRSTTDDSRELNFTIDFSDKNIMAYTVNSYTQKSEMNCVII